MNTEKIKEFQITWLIFACAALAFAANLNPIQYVTFSKPNKMCYCFIFDSFTSILIWNQDHVVVNFFFFLLCAFYILFLSFDFCNNVSNFIFGHVKLSIGSPITCAMYAHQIFEVLSLRLEWWTVDFCFLSLSLTHNHRKLKPQEMNCWSHLIFRLVTEKNKFILFFMWFFFFNAWKIIATVYLEQ